jgi:hypothetical protein
MAQSKVTKAAMQLKAATGQGSSVSMTEVAEHFFQRVGGPKEFAKLLYDELQASKPGGLIRSRILDMVIQTLKFVSIQAPPLDDMSVLSDEDLERELKKQTAKVMRDEEAQGPQGQGAGSTGGPGPGRSGAKKPGLGRDEASGGDAVQGADAGRGDAGEEDPGGGAEAGGED